MMIRYLPLIVYRTPIKLVNRALFATFVKQHFSFGVRQRLHLSCNESKLLDCLVLGKLYDARQLLDEMPQRGSQGKVITWTSILSKIAKEGFVDEAKALFDIMPERNIVSYNAMLSGYVQSCRMTEACSFFEAMSERNVVSWTSMLCGLMNSRKVQEAKALFERMPERNVVSWNSMVAGFVKNGDLEGARLIFDSMPVRDFISWNTMIDGYVENCMMEEARALFDQMTDKNVVTWTTLIAGYCRAGDVWSAYDVFRKTPVKNIVTWTAMIGGFSWNGYYEEAISLYVEMRRVGDVKPNEVTHISLAYACAGVGFPLLGMQLHAHLITSSSEYHVLDGQLSNSLIHMYAMNGLMEYAHSVFVKNPRDRTIQSCNAMINGYVQKGQLENGKNVFDNMSVRDEVSWTSMITGYLNVGKVVEACELFNNMPERDAIAWTAMISGFVQNELFSEAMLLFSEMWMLDIIPLEHTFSTLLGAAGAAAHLDHGRLLHCLLIKSEANVDIILENSLISMYAKCGQIGDAYQVFSNMACRDVISWNSMIMGFSHHGLANEALSLFNCMKNSSVKPNSVTFLGVLSACSHTGLIDEGWIIYRAMSETYGVHPVTDHDVCMINLLGRAGRVKEAEQFVLSLPSEQVIAIWGALLTICGVNEENSDVASHASSQLFQLDPSNAPAHIVMCNMHAAAGQYGKEGLLRKEMRSKRVRKVPGCSWISSGRETHVFLSGDTTESLGDETRSNS